MVLAQNRDFGGKPYGVNEIARLSGLTSFLIFEAIEEVRFFVKEYFPRYRSIRHYFQNLLEFVRDWCVSIPSKIYV